MSVQPLPGHPAATRTIPTTTAATAAGAGGRPAPGPGPDRDADRLLRTWVALAARFASAVSHDLPETQALLRQLSAVEEALLDRHPDTAMAGLWVWEATLVHTGTGPVAECLICRRALLDLPFDLPLPPSVQGTRPGGGR